MARTAAPLERARTDAPRRSLAQGRARTPLPRVEAEPFLKWAGGKGQLLTQFADLYPRRIERYVEPFVGGAAVFFDLRARFELRAAALSDNNDELINCYTVVRDRVEELIELLAQHKRRHHAQHPDYYYKMRDTVPRDPVRRAARLIYLNKTCYNGLYRVNSRGQFNVPIGRYRNPPICDPDLLRRASAALQGVELRVCDFAAWLDEAQPGDFFYIDPPYFPLSKTANFTAYTHGGFGLEEQVRLAGFVRQLDARGCLVMVSNSDTQVIRDLYAGLRITTVTARRAINSNGARRGPTNELVITNYDPQAS